MKKYYPTTRGESRAVNTFLIVNAIDPNMAHALADGIQRSSPSLAGVDGIGKSLKKATKVVTKVAKVVTGQTLIKKVADKVLPSSVIKTANKIGDVHDKIVKVAAVGAVAVMAAPLIPGGAAALTSVQAALAPAALMAAAQAAVKKKVAATVQEKITETFESPAVTETGVAVAQDLGAQYGINYDSPEAQAYLASAIAAEQQRLAMENGQVNDPETDNPRNPDVKPDEKKSFVPWVIGAGIAAKLLLF